MQACTDAPALLAANQNVLLEHQFANVLKADRHFVELAAELRGQLVDELRDRKSLCDVAWKVSRSGEVPHKQRQNLVWIDEASCAVNRANAVAIAIGAEARIVIAGEHGLPQRFDVWLDGF